MQVRHFGPYSINMAVNVAKLARNEVYHPLFTTYFIVYTRSMVNMECSVLSGACLGWCVTQCHYYTDLVQHVPTVAGSLT